MELVKWNPMREMDEMMEKLNRLMGKPMLIQRDPSEDVLTVAEWRPAVDVSETEKEYVFKAELPEVKKEDVKVTIKDGVLTLQGERKMEKEEKSAKLHRVERSYGKFVRSFTLPTDADEKKVAADYKDGILNIRITKSEKAQPKAIEVNIK